jgi:PAS domain S-box-containing protein
MANPPHRPSRSSVWIVDDSALDAEKARNALSAIYDVSVFNDPMTVLERLRSRPPDVLLLDWVMPGMSGLEVCQFVRSLSASVGSLGVIILTAQTEPEQVAEALAAGADDFVSKPIHEVELRARVGAVFRTQRALKRAERAESVVSRLLESAPDALIVTDRDGIITFVNNQAEAALRRDGAPLCGRPVGEVIPELAAAAVRLGTDAPLAPSPDVEIGDQVFSPRIHHDHADGKMTLSLRNVTERRRDEARRLDLYSVVAHDLRTPLSSLLMRTELILRGKRGLLSTELSSDLRKIQASIRSQIAMVTDFLELGRLEGMGQLFESRDLDLQRVVERVCDELAPLAETSQVALRVEPAAGSAAVSGDERRLAQVISNLVGNALKFTPPGGEVFVRTEVREADVEVFVRDTGPGMAPDALPTLFRRYVRPLEGRQDIPGTGLGLMIVREIVEHHGGTVAVQSGIGTGSVFSFKLPRRARRDGEPGPRRTPVEREVADAGGDILVVEDDFDIRQNVSDLLEAEGYAVRLAENGQIARDIVAQSARAPRLIILDLMMPVMDGWEFLRLRSGDSVLLEVPIVVMTAADRDLSDLGDADRIIIKPFASQQILDCVIELCGPPPRG